MQLCETHWDNLKEAIEQRGLRQFVNKDCQSASKEVADRFRGFRNKSTPYDPLLSANFAIWNNALRVGGMYLLESDLCPLCELEKNTLQKAQEWIAPCCDYIAADFRKHGWIPEPS